MKILLDTEQKTISIKGDVKLGDLYNFLEKHYKNDWKEYNLINDLEKELFRPKIDNTNPYRTLKTTPF